MKKLISILILSTVFFTFNQASSESISPLSVKQTKHLAAELRCMELNIHYEARGESIHGKKAVANVTLNRVKSKRFPDTVCKVVKQKNQFTWVKQFPNYERTKVDPASSQLAYESVISRQGLKDNTKGALFFHNKTVDDFNRKLTVIIDNHKFYR